MKKIKNIYKYIKIYLCLSQLGNVYLPDCFTNMLCYDKAVTSVNRSARYEIWTRDSQSSLYRWQALTVAPPNHVVCWEITISLQQANLTDSCNTSGPACFSLKWTCELRSMPFDLRPSGLSCKYPDCSSLNILSNISLFSANKKSNKTYKTMKRYATDKSVTSIFGEQQSAD